MDTPTIAQYYREHDPMKRKALLDRSMEEGDSPQEDQIRRELWELRYKEPSQVEKNNRADGFLALWMEMEFNKDAGHRLFGGQGARKNLNRRLKNLKFDEFQEKGGLYQELLYRECCHLVKLYMELCETDRSYGSALCGLINIGQDKLKDKIQSDVYNTAVVLPQALGMEEELGILTRAAREMYELHYPGEGGI
ncbi:MAG: hypothetical protein Q4D55_05710 [Eubacteriales bacterium]|nr:hypothetical protein [Eubacteriales bacterium]